MKDIFLFSCFLSQLFILVKSGRTVQNTLKCYQCETVGRDGNSVCPDEDLKVCPNDYAADRCLTSVTKNVSGHYIVRKCALAPCDLPGIQSSLLKLSSNCDRNRDDYNCFTCCDSDGCNLHSSSSFIYNGMSAVLVVALSIGNIGMVFLLLV